MDKHLIRENPFANKELSKITTEMIDALYNDKLDEGYSTNTIRKIHQLLNQAFKQVLKWKKVAHNPVIDADPPSVKTKDTKIWSFDEIHRFLEHCKKRDITSPSYLPSIQECVEVKYLGSNGVIMI